MCWPLRHQAADMVSEGQELLVIIFEVIHHYQCAVALNCASMMVARTCRTGWWPWQPRASNSVLLRQQRAAGVKLEL